MQRSRRAWIVGNGTPCTDVERAPARMWRLVILGAPGVGKGTQAELLGEALGCCALSMGDVFRAAGGQPRRSPALVAALGAMKRGELVPDETVLAVLAERRGCLKCSAGLGFLLDGFPRTVGQAEALERHLGSRRMSLDAVISYELPVETIVARLAGRRVCPTCKAVYHLESRPPQQPGRCDRCATALERRADDQPEAIRTRMEVYERSTRPLAEFYRSRDLLVPISAQGTPAEILDRTLSAPQFAGIRVEEAATPHLCLGS
jgi:adenylate kinase